MHFDCGSHLIHFGGVGSGYSYYKKLSSPVQSYGDWAVGRWSLFAKVFYNENININGIPYHEPTKYTDDGRWCFGAYDADIMNGVLCDMEV